MNAPPLTAAGPWVVAALWPSFLVILTEIVGVFGMCCGSLKFPARGGDMDGSRIWIVDLTWDTFCISKSDIHAVVMAHLDACGILAGASWAWLASSSVEEAGSAK
jgi:hypothetical protein